MNAERFAGCWCKTCRYYTCRCAPVVQSDCSSAADRCATRTNLAGALEQTVWDVLTSPDTFRKHKENVGPQRPLGFCKFKED